MHRESICITVSPLFYRPPRPQYIDAGTVASEVCKDLVLHDTLGHNPFRDFIAMSYDHPALLHIIIANSALHMSNAAQKYPTPSTSGFASPPNLLGLAIGVIEQSKFYIDAMTAKQQALGLLRCALLDLDTVNIDVTLAVIFLFINFDLI
jgi:hypothetical protein